ncbi:MAG TPA: hypothetical protein VF125_01155 [Solirubrobacterales bacterium]
MKLRRKLRVLAVTVGAIGVLAALGASPAMAELVDTKFNASTAKLSGSNLTVKKNGGEAKTCELKATTGKAGEATGSLQVYSQIFPFFQVVLECTGGTILWVPLYASTGRYDTVTGAYSMLLYTGVNREYTSPYGKYIAGYGGKQVTTGWTNGSGETQSTVDFNETWLGALSSGLANITLSGTITATTSTGGLLTLSH